MISSKWRVANFKMNGHEAFFVDFIQGLKSHLTPTTDPPHVILCPPFPYLIPCHQHLSTSTAPALLGAQNTSVPDAGSYTGQVSVPMLKDVGCQFVILGHSECRTRESDAVLGQKFQTVLHHDLCPILCVGEPLAVREKGQAIPHVLNQIQTLFAFQIPAKIWIAYEPIWSVGTAQTPSVIDILNMMTAIRSFLQQEYEIPHTTLLYGGSVTPESAPDILGCPQVDGVLIGKACLNLDTFLKI